MGPYKPLQTWVDFSIPYYMEMSWELIDPMAHVNCQGSRGVKKSLMHPRDLVETSQENPPEVERSRTIYDRFTTGTTASLYAFESPGYNP